MVVEAKRMDIKRTQKMTKAKENATITAKKNWNFLGELKTEFKKISWTSKDELRLYTKVVVTATFCFGMLIYFADLLIQTFLSGLSYLVQLIAG